MILLLQYFIFSGQCPSHISVLYLYILSFLSSKKLGLRNLLYNWWYGRRQDRRPPSAAAACLLFLRRLAFAHCHPTPLITSLSRFEHGWAPRSAQNQTVASRIMLKFSPIASKPVGEESAAGAAEQIRADLCSRRVKRKCI